MTSQKTKHKTEYEFSNYSFGMIFVCRYQCAKCERKFQRAKLLTSHRCRTKMAKPASQAGEGATGGEGVDTAKDGADIQSRPIRSRRKGGRPRKVINVVQDSGPARWGRVPRRGRPRKGEHYLRPVPTVLAPEGHISKAESEQPDKTTEEQQTQPILIAEFPKEAVSDGTAELTEAASLIDGAPTTPGGTVVVTEEAGHLVHTDPNTNSIVISHSGEGTPIGPLYVLQPYMAPDSDLGTTGPTTLEVTLQPTMTAAGELLPQTQTHAMDLDQAAAAATEGTTVTYDQAFQYATQQLQAVQVAGSDSQSLATVQNATLVAMGSDTATLVVEASGAVISEDQVATLVAPDAQGELEANQAISEYTKQEAEAMNIEEHTLAKVEES